MGVLLVQNKSACHHLVTFATMVAMEMRYVCSSQEGGNKMILTGGQNINQLQLIILHGKRHYFRLRAGFIGKKKKKRSRTAY